MYIGNIDISKIYKGSTVINKIYQGDILLYASGTIPIFVSATVENAAPTKVILTYDQDLDGTSVPAAGDFTVTDHTISGVAIVGATVELTLSTAVIYFDILYATYTAGANPIKGLVGGLQVANLASTLITNNVTLTGNEVFHYLASDLTTITKDGSNLVSRWNDKLGSGRDLIQVIGTNQPLWSADGILFDGVDNFMKCAAFTWNQPEFIIIVFKQVTWTINDIIFDGTGASNRGRLMQRTASPGLSIYAGTQLELNNNLAVNTWGIVRTLFNGANSELQINNTAALIGNTSTQNMNGFILGCSYTTIAAYSNIQVAEIISLKIAPSSDYKTSLYNVVKRRNNL